MVKIFKYLERVIILIFVLIMLGIISLTAIIFVRQYNMPITTNIEQYQLLLLNVVLLCLAIILLIFTPKILKQVANISVSKKHSIIIALLLTCSYFGIALFWIVKSDLTIMWDYRDLYNLATIYFETGSLAAMNDAELTTQSLIINGVTYLNQFPNNLGLLFLLIVVGHIFGHSVLTYGVGNLLMMCITFILIFSLIKKHKKNNALALFGMIFSMLFLPFLLYTPIFYNDVLVMPFILTSLYLLFDDQYHLTKNKLKLFAVFLLMSVGFIFRAPLIIVIIAIIIIFILHKRIVAIACFLLTVFTLMTSFNFFVDQTGIYEDRKEIGVPVFHWIAMAQNEYTLGQNYIYDYLDTFEMLYNKRPKSEIVEKKKALFLERIKEKGLVGNIVFNAKKISYLWGDPLYEGWFTYLLDPNDKQIHKNMFSDGIGAIFIYSYAKVYQNILYIGLLLLGVQKLIKKRYNAFDLITMLTLIGFFLFYLLWEVHPRYLLCVLPVFITYLFVGRSNDIAKIDEN